MNEHLYLLVPSPNYHNSWAWLRSRLRAGVSMQVSHIGGRNQIIWATFLAVAEKLGIESMSSEMGHRHLKQKVSANPPKSDNLFKKAFCVLLGSFTYPKTSGYCMSPASHLCTGSSEHCPSLATPPRWSPQPHPQMIPASVTKHFSVSQEHLVTEHKVSSFFCLCVCVCLL